MTQPFDLNALTRTGTPEATESELVRLLTNSKLEVIPLKNLDKQIQGYTKILPLTVTCSPRLGVDHTLDTAERLTAQGYRVAPHLAAKLVRGRDHLQEIVDRLAAISVDDVFVIGGDAPAAEGPYHTAGELLQALAGLNHGIGNIGIGAYPEGHPQVSDEALLEALQDKQRHATYLSTQMCFDPAVIDGWINQVANRGIDLPVYLGVPGAIKVRKLIDIALRIGVGDSLRYLKNQRSLAKSLLRNGSYYPDDLLQAASRLALHSELEIKGLHIFTFNQIEQTCRWYEDCMVQEDVSV